MPQRPYDYDVAQGQTSPPIPLNYLTNDFKVTLQVAIASGAINATVQYTNDDIRREGWNPATANWFNHADLTAVTALAVGTLISPVSAVRMSNTGAGVARLSIRSSGK
jgi:hypothetical protein